MANLLIDPIAHGYHALIDWSCAHWTDCAFDFLGMPLAAVPFLLAGHREVAPLDHDETAVSRILWRRLQLLLSTLPRGAAKGCSWGERPMAWLVDLLRFFLAPPDDRWQEVGPPPHQAVIVSVAPRAVERPDDDLTGLHHHSVRASSHRWSPVRDTECAQSK